MHVFALLGHLQQSIPSKSDTPGVNSPWKIKEKIHKATRAKFNL